MAGTLTVLYFDDGSQTWKQLKNRIANSAYDDTAVISNSNLPFQYGGGSPVLSCQITDEIGLPLECDLVLNDTQKSRKPYEVDSLHPESFGSNPLANPQINQLTGLLPELTRIIIHDSESFMTLFVGRVYKSEEKFIANFGTSLQLHCRDALQSLVDNDCTALDEKDRIIYIRGLGDNDAKTGNTAVTNGKGNYPTSISRHLDIIKDLILKTTFGSSSTQDITYVDHKIDKDRDYIQAFSKQMVNESGTETGDEVKNEVVGKIDYGGLADTAALAIIQGQAQKEKWTIGSNNPVRQGYEYFLDSTRTTPALNNNNIVQQDFTYFRRGYYHTSTPQTYSLTAKYATNVGIDDYQTTTNDTKRNMFNDFNFAGFENDIVTHITFSHQGRRENKGTDGQSDRWGSADWGWVSDDRAGVDGDKTVDARTLSFTILYVKPKVGYTGIGPFRHAQRSPMQEWMQEFEPNSVGANNWDPKHDARTFRQVTSLHKTAGGKFSSPDNAKQYFSGNTKTWIGNIQFAGIDDNDNLYLLISDPQEDIIETLSEDDVLYERGFLDDYTDNDSNNVSRTWTATYDSCRFKSYPSKDRKFKKIAKANAEMIGNPESYYHIAREEMARRLAGGNNDLVNRMRNGMFRIKDWPHVRWTGVAQVGTTANHLKPVIASGLDPLDYGMRRGSSAFKIGTDGEKYVGYISAVNRSTDGVDITLKKASALGTTAEGTPAGAGAWTAGDTYNIYCPLRVGMTIRVDNSMAVTVGDHIITSISFEWNNGHVSSEITTVGVNDKVMYKAAKKLYTNPNPMVHEIQKTATIDAISLAANAYEARGVLWWHDHAYLATPNLAAATLRDYNSFSWSGGKIKVHSASAWPGTFQINPGNTDAALTYAGYTSPMQANKQYVLYLDRNDPKADGTFDIRIAELTHDDDGYSKAPSFINMAYLTIGKNVSAGSKTLKGNFNSDGSHYSVTIPFDGSAGNGMGMVNIQFMNTFTNVDGVDGILVEGSRILQPNSMGSALLSKGARPWSSDLAILAYNNLHTRVTWHNGTGGQNANLEFADGDEVTITAGTSEVLAENTHYMYLDGTSAGLTGSLTPQFTTDHGTATGDDKVLLALVVVGDDDTQKSPLILPFNSKQPTINATAIATDALIARHIQAGQINTTKLNIGTGTNQIAGLTSAGSLNLTSIGSGTLGNIPGNISNIDDGGGYSKVKSGNLTSGDLDFDSSSILNKNLNYIAETSARKHVSANQRDGGGRAYEGLNTNNRVAQNIVAAASSEGENVTAYFYGGTSDSPNNLLLINPAGLASYAGVDGAYPNFTLPTYSTFQVLSSSGQAQFGSNTVIADSDGLKVYSAASGGSLRTWLKSNSGMAVTSGYAGGLWFQDLASGSAGTVWSYITTGSGTNSNYGHSSNGTPFTMTTVYNDIILNTAGGDIMLRPKTGGTYDKEGYVKIGDRPIVFMDKDSATPSDSLHSTTMDFVGFWKKAGDIGKSTVYRLPWASNSTTPSDGQVLAIDGGAKEMDGTSIGNAVGDGIPSNPYVFDLKWVDSGGGGTISSGSSNKGAYYSGTTTISPTTFYGSQATWGSTSAGRITSVATQSLRVSGTIAEFSGLNTDTGTSIKIDSSNRLVRSSSSRRYKENIADLDMDTSPIYDLALRTFKYKDYEVTVHDEDDDPEEASTETVVGDTSFGLIAEEVNELFPDLVLKNKDGEPEDVQYPLLSVLLLSELKKLKARIEILEGN